MGKIKRERQKYHLTSGKKDDKIKEPHKCESQKYNMPDFQLNCNQNIFSGIQIQLSDICSFDEKVVPAKILDFEKSDSDVTADEKSVTKLDTGTVPCGQQKRMTKKEKMLQKRKKLMEKLSTSQSAKTKSRKQTPKLITNDEQILLKSKLEYRSLHSSALTSISEKNKMNKTSKKIPTMVPSFKDDLPPLFPILESRKSDMIQNRQSVNSKSKAISKNMGRKKDLIKNYNILKKAMSKKLN